jgi:anti-sigma factor RsiW
MKRTNFCDAEHPCLALFERLSEYIDQELDTSTRTQIETHIAACRPCRICLDSLQQTVKLCRHLASDPVPESVSLKLKAAIVAMLNGNRD